MNNQNGKLITISSVKGGVGKTTITTNLAGLYFLMKKKVLIIDLDLYAGGIATVMNVNSKKDIYMLADALSNNKQVELADYVSNYNKGIDVLAAPKDPRNVSKIEGKYINKIFDLARHDYDIVLVDTSHSLDEVCLVSMDAAYNTLFVIRIRWKYKNKIVLNNSRDTGRDYITPFDIRNMIKGNIDYTISKNFYIKNIDKYVLNGEILTLNKNITRFYNNDIKNMNKLALSLIEEVKKDDGGEE